MRLLVCSAMDWQAARTLPAPAFVERPATFRLPLTTAARRSLVTRRAAGPSRHSDGARRLPGPAVWVPPGGSPPSASGRGGAGFRRGGAEPEAKPARGSKAVLYEAARGTLSRETLGRGLRQEELARIYQALESTGQDSAASDDYAFVVNSLRRSLMWSQALVMWSLMKEEGFRPDARVYTDVICASSKGNAWTVSLHLLHEMIRRDMVPRRTTYNSVISACRTGGLWRVALHLLTAIPQPKTDTCNAAISSLTRCSQWQRALVVYGDMLPSQMAPNERTFCAAIDACSVGQQWELALCLLADMSRWSAAPNFMVYNAAVSACERAAKWEAALAVLSDMQEAKVEPRVAVFNSAISACAESLLCPGVLCQVRPHGGSSVHQMP